MSYGDKMVVTPNYEAIFSNYLEEAKTMVKGLCSEEQLHEAITVRHILAKLNIASMSINNTDNLMKFKDELMKMVEELGLFIDTAENN